MDFSLKNAFSLRHKKPGKEMTLNDILPGDTTMRYVQRIGRELYRGFLRNQTLDDCATLKYYGGVHQYTVWEDGKERIKRRLSAQLPKLATEHIRKKMFGKGVEVEVETKAGQQVKENLSEYLDELIDYNDHWRNLADLVEDALNTGGMVMKPTVINGKLEIEYIKAEKFWHTQYNNKMIFGGVFISYIERNDYHYTKLSWYTRNKDGNYEIVKQLYKSKTRATLGEQVPYAELFDDEQKYTMTGYNSVPFTYWKPNIKNNVVPESPLGLGLSINAIDKIKFLDTAYHRYFQELDSGGIKRALPRYAFNEQLDDDGNIKSVYNKDDETIMLMDVPPESEVQAVNLTPQLRVEQFEQALNTALDFGSAAFGISTGSFRFDGTKIQTATETEIRAYETHETKLNHEETLKEALDNLFRSCIEMAKAENLDTRVNNIPEDLEIKVNFEDKMFYNEQEELNKLRQDAMDGIVPMWKYVLKAYDEVQTEDEAKAWVKEADEADILEAEIGIGNAEDEQEG